MSWKLVRDNHEKLLRGRISGQWRVSPDPVGALVTKLGEEYGEFAKDRDPGELFDMLDAIMELRAILDPLREHRDAHLIKKAKWGGFGAHLEWHPDPELDIPQEDS